MKRSIDLERLLKDSTIEYTVKDPLSAGVTEAHRFMHDNLVALDMAYLVAFDDVHRFGFTLIAFELLH